MAILRHHAAECVRIRVGVGHHPVDDQVERELRCLCRQTGAGKDRAAQRSVLFHHGACGLTQRPALDADSAAPEIGKRFREDKYQLLKR